MEISIKWKMCRTCHRSAELQPLYDDAHISKHLRLYAGVVVKQGDGLPDKICTLCQQQLQAAHTFLSGCQKADEHLKSVVNRTMSTRSCFPSGSDVDAYTDDEPKQKRGNFIKKQLEDATRPSKKQSEGSDMRQPATAELMDDVEGGAKPNAADTDMSEFLNVQQAKAMQKAATDNEFIIVINEADGGMEDSDNNETAAATDMLVVDDGNVKYDVAHGAIENDAYVLNMAQNVEHLIEEDGYQAQQELALKTEDDEAPEEHDVDLRAVCKFVHSCEQCGNTFPLQSLLRTHMRTHRHGKSYECELCAKTFNAACNLRTHMRTHTGEKPYECNFCGRRFADRSTHRKHERIHTNERPFTCHRCGKSFSLSTSLKAHEAVHSHEKPYKCTTCNKGFKLPHQLKAHSNTHVHRYEAGLILYTDEDDFN